MALVVLFTGGLISPWLYFFLATSIVSSAILPRVPGRALTAVNAAAALLVIIVSAHRGLPAAWMPPVGVWPGPAYATVVGFSLIGLIGLSAYAVSVPVENARVAARFQESMTEIALSLQRASAVDSAPSAVCAHAHRWFGAERTALMLLEGEELVCRAAEGSGAAGLLGRRVPVSDMQSLDVEVLRRRAGFYVNDLRRSPYAEFPAVAQLGDRAILLVPLIGNLGTLGVLSLAYGTRAGRFTPVVLQRASILAAQAGIALENARLLERVREEADSVTAMLSALEHLTKSYDLTTLLTDLNRIAAELVRCERSTTFLWDAERQVFYFGSTYGNPAPLADAMRQFEFARGTTPIIDRVLSGETFVISPDQVMAYLPAGFRDTLRLGASAVIPLVTEHGLQGVMTVSYLEASQTFTAEQLWTLRGIARHAALAIERARLIAQEREATATAEALVALGRELSATLDQQQVLARIPEIAAKASGCDFAALGFWDRQKETARIVGAYGFPPDLSAELLQLSVHAPVSPLFDELLRQGHFEMPSMQPIAGLPFGLIQHFEVSSLLCALFGPIEHRIGSLTVGYRTRTGAFTAAQKQLLNGIVQQATVVFENARLVGDLREANRVKSDFLSTVSHELRTPLNAIIGYTDLLREGALGPLHGEQVEVMEILNRKGVQLLELINTTLDLTRLEAGHVRMDIAVFPLAELLTEIHQDLADEVPPLVEFTYYAAPELPPLRTDRLKLKTIIRNLAHNALKFTREGRVDVQGLPGPDASRVTITVVDTGIGIAAENVQAIFDMFRQLEPALTRRFGGVGLGLYIVQRLLDLLGGEIRVESQPGEGSTFTVAVPLEFHRPPSEAPTA
jgi:signal transduction histidine kinase/transcriptional regulator with GAF, ATPase, and Fis domain